MATEQRGQLSGTGAWHVGHTEHAMAYQMRHCVYVCASVCTPKCWCVLARVHVWHMVIVHAASSLHGSGDMGSRPAPGVHVGRGRRHVSLLPQACSQQHR